MVHIGVVAFNTEAMLLAILVSLKPINVHGKTMLTKATRITDFHGMLLILNGLRISSINKTIKINPKLDLRNTIVHGPT